MIVAIDANAAPATNSASGRNASPMKACRLLTAVVTVENPLQFADEEFNDGERGHGHDDSSREDKDKAERLVKNHADALPGRLR